MTGFLARACDEAHARVAAAAATEPLGRLRDRALGSPAPPSFGDALRRPGVGVIAEIKRASPSRGAIAAIPDAESHARAYARGGAAAVSVLTEPVHFQGSLEDLAAVAAGVELPVLRKDFVVDAYQVLEARAAGAAAVLLIVAAVDVDRLAQLMRAAAEAGLDALVEVHDQRDLDNAVAARAAVANPGPLILGVNARDLTTLQVDPATFARVRDAAPPGAVLVAESGVRGPEEVAGYAAAGADAVLVGEHLVLADDPSTEVRRLVDAGAHAITGRLRATDALT